MRYHIAADKRTERRRILVMSVKNCDVFMGYPKGGVVAGIPLLLFDTFLAVGLMSRQWGKGGD